MLCYVYMIVLNSLRAVPTNQDVYNACEFLVASTKAVFLFAINNSILHYKFENNLTQNHFFFSITVLLYLMMFLLLLL